jgi:tetratricopeptide (TPR) repeat protein
MAVLLWSVKNDDNGANKDRPLQLSRIQIRNGDKLVDLSQRTTLSGDELAQLMMGRIALLTSGAADDRRAMALQLAQMTADPAERERLAQLDGAVVRELRAALATGLNDDDPSVAANCRDALVGLWRMSGSDAASEAFSQGLAAYDAGQFDSALATFSSVARLGGSVPPDLYRLTAEIYLSQKKYDKALEECRKAVQAEKTVQPEQHSFLTLYVLARIYHAQGQDDKALKALDGALLIYHSYPEATRLRADLLKQQKTVTTS